MFSDESLHDEWHICQVYSKLLIIGYIFNYHDLSYQLSITGKVPDYKCERS